MKNILGYKKTNLDSYWNSNIEYDRLGESKQILDNGKELYKISKKSNKLENIIKIFNLESAKILER